MMHFKEIKSSEFFKMQKNEILNRENKKGEETVHYYKQNHREEVEDWEFFMLST